MNKPITKIGLGKKTNIENMGRDTDLIQKSIDWMTETSKYNYTYNFKWLGIPIIQFPQDMIAMQEIIWHVKPDLIIETGIAHGGSLIYYASLLELIGENGIVVGIDIDIRAHNRERIETHPMIDRIRLIEGSSIDNTVADQVAEIAHNRQTVIVCLDAMHTHDHVASELSHYAHLVTPGSYLIVFDTLIEDMPDDFFPDRAWGKDNNPKTAVQEFLSTHSEFIVDHTIENKLMITVSPSGYLKRIH